MTEHISESNRTGRDALVHRFVAGELNGAEAGKLLELLENDPTLTAELSEGVYLESLFNDLARAGGNLPEEIDFLPSVCDSYQNARRTDKTNLNFSFSFRRRFKQALFTSLMASILLVSGIVIGIRIMPDFSKSSAPLVAVAPRPVATKPKIERDEPESRLPVAFVKLASAVDWVGESEQKPKMKDTIHPGWLKFRSGVMVIEYFCGTRMVVEGPAELQVVSKNHLYCLKGRIKADVPKQAIGFRIDAPQTSLVDLGTAFQMDISPRQTIVGVAEGKVELQNLPSGIRMIEKGEVVIVGNGGVLRPIDPNVDQFNLNKESTTQILEELQRKENENRVAQQQRQGELLDDDSSLLIHFDFNSKNVSFRTVLNTAKYGRDKIPNGILSGCKNVDGQWEKDGAIEFNRLVDHFRFEIPGEFAELTMAIWIRANEIDKLYNAIFTTDGFSLGELHWYYFWKDRIVLDLFSEEDKLPSRIEASYHNVMNDAVGKWMHLALTIDTRRGNVSLFLNGEHIHQESIRMNIPLKFKTAQLGNWNTDSTSEIHQFRQLSGTIDDYLFFNRALSPDEIRNLYHGSWTLSTE